MMPAISVSADMLGFVAAICTTVAFVPQVLLVWRRRSGEGVSTGMYAILTLGIVLWLCYGLMTNAWPVIIANGVTLLLVVSVLAMKWRFAGRS